MLYPDLVILQIRFLKIHPPRYLFIPYIYRRNTKTYLLTQHGLTEIHIILPILINYPKIALLSQFIIQECLSLKIYLRTLIGKNAFYRTTPFLLSAFMVPSRILKIITFFVKKIKKLFTRHSSNNYSYPL
jgi:hypothetical protein